MPYLTFRQRLITLLVVCLAVPISPLHAREGRIVVIGFDGASANLVERYMAEGKLPHLSALRQRGTYCPLLSTNPPQSPVAWASFTTGTNPGKTNQFDFLLRDPKTYKIDLALARSEQVPLLLGRANPGAAGALVMLLCGLLAFVVRRRPTASRALLVVGAGLGGLAAVWVYREVPASVPRVTNCAMGTPFWELAAEQGVHATIMRVPDTFPPHPFKHGRLLSGLGVPDIRRTIGTFTFFTTNPSLSLQTDPELGGKIRVLSERSSVDSTIPGPRVREPGEPRELEVPVHFEVGAESLTVHVGGIVRSMKVGQWSEWTKVEFEVSPLIKLHGMCRFFLKSLQPDVMLYMTPVNFDPTQPPIAISWPADFSRDLADRFGPYTTLGWPYETWAYNQNLLTEAEFIADSVQTLEEQNVQRRVLLPEEDGLYVQVMAETDTTQHVLWRLTDPLHPGYAAGKARRYGNAICESYQRMDAIVGEVVEQMRPNDTLFVVSDHGFAPYRRSVNLNQWLVENGFMTLNHAAGKVENLENLFVIGQFWPDVDWEKTRAYAFGLGQIFINLQGREGRGAVSPAQYETVRDEIITRLSQLRDKDKGDAAVVASIFKRESLYHGPYADSAPDLRVAFRPGYRVSWQDTMGGIVRPVITDNLQNWSGDHCANLPQDVMGILFCSRKFTPAQNPSIMDIAPTVLRLLGVPPPRRHGRTSFVRTLSRSCTAAGPLPRRAHPPLRVQAFEI